MEERFPVMPARPPESRRITSLLGQRRVSGFAMVVVLSAALLFGLVGFAVHILWIVAIVVLALGLGFVVANVRQNRREAIDRDREDAEEPSDSPASEPSAAPAKRLRTRVPRSKPNQS